MTDGVSVFVHKLRRRGFDDSVGLVAVKGNLQRSVGKHAAKERKTDGVNTSVRRLRLRCRLHGRARPHGFGDSRGHL